MKASMKRLLGCILTLCVLVATLAGATRILERKDSRERMTPFFELADDIDVLFLGTSHVINGIYPMELWRKYGITSYNLGGQDSQMATTYWTLINALDYAHPKVVVVDCFEISNNHKAADYYEYIHLTFDAFPLSINKIKTAFDLTNDPGHELRVEQGVTSDEFEKRTPMGILWDYSVYHSRWKELTYKDFNVGSDCENGAISIAKIAEPAEIIEVPREEKLTEQTVAMDYLNRIIDLCNEKDIQVILTYLPFPATYGDWQEANTVYDIADAYGIKYINFLTESVVDYNTDLCDSTSHLNPSGAIKVTDYLGNILISDYAIPDNRNQEPYTYWDARLQIYNYYLENEISQSEDLKNIVMSLYNDD